MTLVTEIAQEFLFHLEYQRLVTKSTLHTYKYTLKHFGSLYGMKNSWKLTGDHILKYKKYITTNRGRGKNWMKATSVYAEMVRLKTFIKWMYERWCLWKLRPSDVPVNKYVETYPTYLTKAELKLLFQALEKNLRKPYKKRKQSTIYSAYMIRAATHLLFSTGLRNAELRRLKPGDIDMRNMRGRVFAKWSRYYNFMFNTTAKCKLKEFLTFKEKHYWKSKRHMEYIFTSSTRGTKISASHLNNALYEIGRYAWLEKRLHAHVMRHTCWTHMLLNGANLKEAQVKLNHISINNTAIYTHVADDKIATLTQKLGK